jgi:hypothetical protein
MKLLKGFKNQITKFLAKQVVSNTKENYVPFVSEVEEFNAIMGKPNNYNPVIPAEKEWMFVYNFILEELENINMHAKRGILLRFLMLYVTLPTFHWVTELCYMVLRIKYGQHIKKYKRLILAKLAQVKRRHKKPLEYVPKSKRLRVTMRRLVDIISSIEALTRK